MDIAERASGHRLENSTCNFITPAPNRTQKLEENTRPMERNKS
jgi:hypothetical protein